MKLTQTIAFRATYQERVEMNRQAKAMKLTLSEYVRQCVLLNVVQPVRQIVEASKP